jgi:hypothetical protein
MGRIVHDQRQTELLNAAQRTRLALIPTMRHLKPGQGRNNSLGLEIVRGAENNSRVHASAHIVKCEFYLFILSF